MIRLTFSRFRSGRYDDKNERHELYILRDGDDDPVYIGISIRGPWNRWFDGWGSHFTKTVYGEYYPNTSVAREIARCAPMSDYWTVELWTLEDCIQYLADEIKQLHFISDRIDLKCAEGMMIRKLRPAENILLNVKRDDPRGAHQRNDLRDAHHKIYN